MSHSRYLLELIHDSLANSGGDLKGSTQLEGEALHVFDGRVSLRVEEKNAGRFQDHGGAHVHISATLHEYDDEVLDACLFGLGDTPKESFGQAGFIWLSGVAGPIKSFLDNKPVCMTCRAGVHSGIDSENIVQGDIGFAELRAFVGPEFSRGFEASSDKPTTDDTKPWFRYAAAAAAPRRVHLAKATVLSKGKEGWSRMMEVDGCDVSLIDLDWPAGGLGPEFGIVVRYSVFEFPCHSSFMAERTNLDEAIRYFAMNLPQQSSVAEVLHEMVLQGFNSELVHEIESFTPMAFARTYFECFGAKFSPFAIRARSDGRIESEIPLISLPVYARSRVLSAQLFKTMSVEDFEAICRFSSESKVLWDVLESRGRHINMSGIKLYPSIVPDVGASQETMNAAQSQLSEMIARDRRETYADEPKPAVCRVIKLPWWKIW